jgi:hypothetical protein
VASAIADQGATRMSQPHETVLPTPSAWWRDHFKDNRTHFDHVPWDKCSITPDEARAIARSIAEFQLGESSEGKHLIHEARRHADAASDADYALAMSYFIAEENSHALALGRFMDAAALPRKRRTFSDSVFRLLRKGMGLEVSISVLITAELIAQVYYQALRDATQSPALRAICEQILTDERMHIRFQSERLAILQRYRARTGLRLGELARRVLMAGTLPVVWLGHRRALRRGGFGPVAFCRACWACYRVSERLADPAGYDWPDVAPDPA